MLPSSHADGPADLPLLVLAGLAERGRRPRSSHQGYYFVGQGLQLDDQVIRGGEASGSRLSAWLRGRGGA
jgi:hypothetical protein